ncbi:ankyrin repeat protein, partial [Teladorsagia circumcincta]
MFISFQFHDLRPMLMLWMPKVFVMVKSMQELMAFLALVIAVIAIIGIRLKRLSSCGSDPSLAKCDFSVESNDRDIISESARCGDVLGLLRSLAGGADINSARSGTTALHIATKNGQTAAVEFLLLNGAKINVLDDKLNTPL